MRGIRQHVNPLGLAYLEARARRICISPDAHARVEVELGCADADFSFALAKREPTWFVVGLDIRTLIVERNRAKAHRAGLSNIAFEYVNLTVDLDRVFPPNSVDRFHLLFPDPWLKARHRKRRVIGPDLCRVLADQLRDGGELHIATDVFDLALEAMAELEQGPGEGLGFRNLVSPWGFARDAPVDVCSRRERITARRDQRVWRLRYALSRPPRLVA